MPIDITTFDAARQALAPGVRVYKGSRVGRPSGVYTDPALQNQLDVSVAPGAYWGDVERVIYVNGRPDVVKLAYREPRYVHALEIAVDSLGAPAASHKGTFKGGGGGHSAGGGASGSTSAGEAQQLLDDYLAADRQNYYNLSASEVLLNRLDAEGRPRPDLRATYSALAGRYADRQGDLQTAGYFTALQRRIDEGWKEFLSYLGIGAIPLAAPIIYAVVGGTVALVAIVLIRELLAGAQEDSTRTLRLYNDLAETLQPEQQQQLDQLLDQVKGEAKQGSFTAWMITGALAVVLFSDKKKKR